MRSTKTDFYKLYWDQLFNFQTHWIEDMRTGVGALSVLIILISSTFAQDGKISFIATEFEIKSVCNIHDSQSSRHEWFEGPFREHVNYLFSWQAYSATRGHVIRLPIPWCNAIIFCFFIFVSSVNSFRERLVALNVSKETLLM